jgi:hypothetical protein
MNHLVVAFAFVLAAAPASAQQLNLQIQNGRVTLEATAVPARQILAEWARIGGTRIVGGDKVTGAPLTLRLIDMPERQALDIILRNVAGYMAAPRLASAAPGASTYDRILILATSSVPPPPATASRTPAPSNNAIRRPPPRPPNLPPSPAENAPEPDETQTAEDQADTGVTQQPVFTFPAPNPGAPVFAPANNGVVVRPTQPGMAPVITLQPNQNGQPTIYNFVPNADGSMPVQTPAQPVFGVVGSPQPGMIQQPIAPQPVQPQRPPGQ